MKRLDRLTMKQIRLQHEPKTTLVTESKNSWPVRWTRGAFRNQQNKKGRVKFHKFKMCQPVLISPEPDYETDIWTPTENDTMLVNQNYEVINFSDKDEKSFSELTHSI